MLTKNCPICSKPAATGYGPFCSARCQQVDLGRWLTGSYAIPTEEIDEESLALIDDANHES